MSVSYKNLERAEGMVFPSVERVFNRAFRIDLTVREWGIHLRIRSDDPITFGDLQKLSEIFGTTEIQITLSFIMRTVTALPIFSSGVSSCILP